MNKRFSIVICTYNRAKYINESLRTVCEQDYDIAAFEVLVIDNNSSDNTAKVCKAAQEKYPHVCFRYFLETRQGVSFARNRGIEEAESEYIVFIDDDETIGRDHLTKLDNNLKQYPEAELCAVPVEPVYESEKPKWLSVFILRAITGYYNKGKAVRKLGPNGYPGTGHAIIKRNLFDKSGNFSTQLGRQGKSLLGAEDKDMFLRLIKNHVDCYYFPDIPIYHHIPQEKLTDAFFKGITYGIGKSERIRTKSISQKTYLKRIIAECIKWMVSIVLFFGYMLTLRFSKGIKLLQFRKNVSQGLLGF